MRLRSVLIFGVGYLVGTRAGRDRYEQIARSARDLSESDVVRGYVDRASDLVRRPLEASSGEVDEAAADAAGEETRTGGG